MNYQPLSVVASSLKIDEATLLDFGRRSWIKTVERRGMIYADGHQQYKIRYILHLRQRKLTDEQISLVLSVQEPPYSAEKVDQILAESKAPHAR